MGRKAWGGVGVGIGIGVEMATETIVDSGTDADTDPEKKPFAETQNGSVDKATVPRGTSSRRPSETDVCGIVLEGLND